MPRYFFHLEDPTGIIRDDGGEEFASLEEARTFALGIALELGRNRLQNAIAERHLLVMDAAGVIVFRTPLHVAPF
jgi:hypothetical protein